MGKQYHSETKTSKLLQKSQANKTKKIIRHSSYQKKPKENNEKFEPISKNTSNTINFPLDTGITALINSLDNQKIISSFIISTDINVKFPSKINDRQFMDLFKKGINSAKMKFKQRNLTILKNILLFLKDVDRANPLDDFGFQNCKNELQKTYRKDLILTLLTDESKIEGLNIKDPNDAVKSFQLNIDYGIYMSNNDFNDALIYNENENGNYSFQKFKDILFSPSIIKIYQESIQDLYGAHVSEKELKKIIKDFISKNNIYFILMDIKRYGMVLYDGTILINKAYYVNYYSSINIFRVYFTLLHELMHAISRLIRGNNNYFLNTDEFIKLNGKNIKADESGNYFEDKYLLCTIIQPKLTQIESDYLLDFKNYEYDTYKKFINAFKQFRLKHAVTIQNSPSFAIGKTSSDDSIPLRFGCYCAGSRNNY